MPSAWSLIDASFPTFTGEERVREQFSVMLNYMYMLAEGLKYQLSNLNAENFNSTALKNIQIETTEDVEKEVADILAEIDIIKSNIGSITNKLNGLTEWKEVTEKTIEGMTTDIKNLSDTQKTHGDTLDSIKGVIVPDGSGGASIGKDGATLNLVGKVYINGTLFE